MRAVFLGVRMDNRLEPMRKLAAAQDSGQSDETCQHGTGGQYH